MSQLSAVVLSLVAALGGDAPAPAGQSYVVQVPGGVVRYQLPAAAGPVTEQVASFSIMHRQVSQAEYAACVDKGGCSRLDAPWDASRSAKHPVVGISWQDAQAYANWFSQSTGVPHRLPRYAEWLHAAGEGFVVDEPLVDDPANPARRWLAEYEREARRRPASQRLERFAQQRSSGELSVADNVWEWTDTCFVGAAADGFCGIRFAAGRHPSALSDFIRDPVAGACSVGAPPTYVGLRLVRD